ncbi:unnamed protein product, partial [Meganyctiphanes norvegica]
MKSLMYYKLILFSKYLITIIFELNDCVKTLMVTINLHDPPAYTVPTLFINIEPIGISATANLSLTSLQYMFWMSDSCLCQMATSAQQRFPYTSVTSRCRLNIALKSMPNELIFNIGLYTNIFKCILPNYKENTHLGIFYKIAKISIFRKCQNTSLQGYVFLQTLNHIITFKRRSVVEMIRNLRGIYFIGNIQRYCNTDTAYGHHFWQSLEEVKLMSSIVLYHKSSLHAKFVHMNAINNVFGSFMIHWCITLEYALAYSRRWSHRQFEDVIALILRYLASITGSSRDWVTEKFFRTLGQDVVPVVMGGADYKQLAPPNSYIDALEFSSPKTLADFLKKVSSSPVLYNRYLEWKSYYTVDVGFPYSPMVCGLCEKLHQQRFSKSLVGTKSNLTSWFADAGCQGTWKQFIKNNHVNI